MSIASKIKEAVAFTGLPCAQNIYQGQAKAYFVFNIITIPDDFADDAPQYERCQIMLHLFAPIVQNTTELQGQIKQALFDADFDYPRTISTSDETAQHIIFETEAIWLL